MSPPTAETEAPMTGTPSAEGSPAAIGPGQGESRSVPEGVTVVFAERKRTGRVAGAKYKADGTPYKRPGPAPKPLHERASYQYQHRGPLKRVERSYTEQKRREVVLFLQSHKMRIEDDEKDPSGRPMVTRGRGNQAPPEEKGYRWPTLREASDWFKIPERTIHGWWKRRDRIFGTAPKRLTKAEKRRLAEEEERKSREAGERRVLLEAIGWPATALPPPCAGDGALATAAEAGVGRPVEGMGPETPAVAAASLTTSIPVPALSPICAPASTHSPTPTPAPTLACSPTPAPDVRPSPDPIPASVLAASALAVASTSTPTPLGHTALDVTRESEDSVSVDVDKTPSDFAPTPTTDEARSERNCRMDESDTPLTVDTPAR